LQSIMMRLLGSTKLGAREMAAATVMAEGGDMDMDDNADYILELEPNFDGSLVAVSLSSQGVGIHDAETLAEVARLEGLHSSRINGIKFMRQHPHTFVTSSEDKHVRVWDLRQPREAGPCGALRCHEEVMDVAAGHGDALLACAVGTSVIFYDVRNTGASSAACAWASAPAQLGEYSDVHTDSVTQLRFHPQRDTELTTAGEDGLVCTFNTKAAEGDDAVLSIMNSECPVRRFGFFGQHGEGLHCLSSVETASFWHPASAQKISTFPSIREDFGLDYLVDCFHTAGGELLLLGGTHGGDARLLRVTPDAVSLVGTAKGGHSATIRCATSSVAGGGKFVTGGEDSRLCAWALEPTAEPAERGKSKSRSTKDRGRDKGLHHSPY